MVLTKSVEIGGRTLSIETGELARQADGAAVVRYGDTMVLVTACMGGPREADFFPLSVDFVAKTYSAGKIPGGYFKREGRPTEYEILTSRLVDRPIRPLFPEGCRNDVQVVAMVLSTDRENEPSILAMIGASAALSVSDIPWKGPVAAIRVGRIDGKLVANPVHSQDDQLDLDFTIAVGRDGVVMVEGEAKFVPEDVLVDVLMFAQDQVQPLLAAQEEMARELCVAKRKLEVLPDDEALQKKVEKLASAQLKKAFAIKVKKSRYEAVSEVHKSVLQSLAEEYPEGSPLIERYFEKTKKAVARGILFGTGKRIDGRSTTDVRDITCKVGVLPRTHGSALFTRGETQAIVTLTLGSAQDMQRIDGITDETTRRYMLHYNFPPFSVGEVRPMRGPSRRDIGHGHLAQRGTEIILPSLDAFPYAIRMVSEILESNGSSSMATVCGTSLALMDGGVPIAEPVAGVAMGLMKEKDKVFVLSDILGDEDHMGDMDFKVVGNREGVSAVQMDIKISGLTREIFETALGQAKQARNHILDCMAKALTEPRKELSQYAPRIFTVQINPEKIGALIGPGGKNIRSIIDQTGVAIDVNDDGKVNVAAVDGEAAAKAIALIQGCTAEAEVGRNYMGKVVKIVDFGAFIQILPGIEGLCHISELADRRVERVDDVLSEGDEVMVKVIAVDAKSGKVKLSRREAMRR
jgi:polyribonucleotide nucleotidyltransferase